MPMHDSTRDQLLDIMVSDGWANKSDGECDSPQGHFAIVTNAPRELDSVIDAFEDAAKEIDPEFDFSEMVGHFLVLKDSAGFLSVIEYTTHSDLLIVFGELERAFSLWMGDDD